MEKVKAFGPAERFAESTPQEVKIYSYVVHHDEGRRPDPYFEVCTLCGCKCRWSRKHARSIEELAKKGDWVIGTGGKGKRSAGHGKLIYEDAELQPVINVSLRFTH